MSLVNHIRKLPFAVRAGRAVKQLIANEPSVPQTTAEAAWWSTAIYWSDAFGIAKPGIIVNAATTANDLAALCHRAAYTAPLLVTFDAALEGKTLGGWNIHLCESYILGSIDGIVVLAGDAEEFVSILNFACAHDFSGPVLPGLPKITSRHSFTELLGGQNDTRICLYNHFERYYLIKDPIQVLYEVVDEGGVVTSGTKWLLANTHSELWTHDICPPDFNCGLFRCFVFHPALNRTSNRFRLVSDLYRNGSVDTMHGIEVFKMLNHPSQMFAPIGGGHDVRIILSAPSVASTVHTQALTETTEVVISARPAQGESRTRKTVALPRDGRGKSVVMSNLFPELTGNQSCWTYFDVAANRDTGVFNWLIEGPGANGAPSFMFNHGFGRSNAPTLPASDRLREDKVASLQFPIPLFPDRYKVDPFLLLVDVADGLTVQHIIFEVYAANGDHLGQRNLTYRFDRDRYFDVREALGDLATRAEGGLVLMRNGDGDWFNGSVHMVVENRESGDRAFTELQVLAINNVPYYVNGIQGTYLPPRSIKARTHLAARVIVDNDHDTLLTVLNGAASLRRHVTAHTKLILVNAAGDEQVVSLDICTMAHHTMLVSELFPDFALFCPDGRGWIRIDCRNAQLRAYHALQYKKTGSIALQHFWGM